MDSEIYDSIVIGGGIAGVLSALKLSNNTSSKILLLERDKELLSNNSSSYNGCYKIHTGLHFLKDLNTAKLCLYKGIQFVKEFKQFLLGDDILNKHLKRSRFYLMSNSAISINDAINNTNELIKYYNHLIDDDQSNKVLGEVNEFINIVPNEYYNQLISKDIEWYNEHDELVKVKVELCFEYSEYILDFQLFKDHIINQINLTNNITLKLNYNVKLISYYDHLNHYMVSNCINYYNSKSIINCSFESIEQLDKQIFNDSDSVNNNCIIRIKCTVVISIPESMKSLSSFLFGIGPYSGFLVNPNNKLVLVSERSSNIGHFNPNEPIPKSIQMLLESCTLDTHKGREIANSILYECSHYLNEPFKSDILNSTILELKKGYVKIYQNEIYSNKSLYNSNSGVHQRLEELKYKSYNYISNCSTKLTYSLDDSYSILNYINKYK